MMPATAPLGKPVGFEGTAEGASVFVDEGAESTIDFTFDTMAVRSTLVLVLLTVMVCVFVVVVGGL